MNIPRLAKLLGEADERYILEAAEEETKMTPKITRRQAERSLIQKIILRISTPTRAICSRTR